MRGVPLNGWRFLRILLVVLLVLAPAAAGMLVGSNAVSAADGPIREQAGPYTITASAGPGGSISPSGEVIIEGENLDQTFTITPDPNYHVLDVLVDGVSVGAVTSHTISNVIGDHTIVASFAIDTFTITPSAGPNGTITPAVVQTVDYGATPTFTFTPDTGYHVLDVLVDGVSVGATENYTFPAVAASHTISVSFAIDRYTITPSAGPNGVITPAVVQAVDYGATPTFTFTPDTGYHVAAVLVDGSSVGTGTSYTFPAVAASHTISVTFAIDTHTIAASVVGGNGSISPSGAVAVSHGANQTFTISPAANYHVADVLVDGVSVGAVTSRTFTNVTADHTIVASFAIDTHTISASVVGGNGSISPSGAVAVSHGANQTFTISPAANYHVADVLVDGVSVGAVTSHTFTNVTADHTIVASFAIDTHTISGQRRRRQRQHLAERRRPGQPRRQPDLHHHPGRQLPRRRRARRRRLRGRGHEPHLHQCHRRSHHRRQLRDRHPHDQRPASSAATAASRRAAPSRSTTAPTRPSPSPRPPTTTSPTCSSTGSPWARSRAAPSPMSPPITPSSPASRSTPTRSRPASSAATAASRRAAPSRSTTAPTRPSPSPRPPTTTSPTCSSTASPWARSRATPSPMSPPITPSSPASRSTPTRSRQRRRRQRQHLAERRRRRSTTAPTRPSPSPRSPTTTSPTCSSTASPWAR